MQIYKLHRPLVFNRLDPVMESKGNKEVSYLNDLLGMMRGFEEDCKKVRLQEVMAYKAHATKYKA